jgi:hypothetical protein
MSPDDDSSNSVSEDGSEQGGSDEENLADSIIDVKFLAIGFLVGVIMLSMLISTESESTPSVDDADNKVYVNDSLSEIQSQLLGSESAYTDLQKEEIWRSRYTGRWIKGNAYVHSVDENAFGKLVVLAGPQAESELDIGFSPYRIVFKDSERSDLLQVRPNQRINFEGKLTEFGGITSSISISEARVIE